MEFEKQKINNKNLIIKKLVKKRIKSKKIENER